MTATTIIKPNQRLHRPFFNSRFVIALGALLTLIGASVYAYNYIVALQHHLRRQRADAEAARLKNVDLKSQLYQLVEGKRLTEAAARAGLVPVNNPEFLPVETSLAASPR